MKKILALLVICFMFMTILAACTPPAPEGPTPPDNVCTDHTDGDGDYKCDDCGKVLFEEVKYSLNIADLPTETLAEESVNGNFTISAGTEIRNRTKVYEGVEYTKSVKFGSNANQIKVSVPGTGKLTFLVQNGSSGADMQFISVISPDGKKQDIEFVGKVESNPIVKIEVDVTEGEWIIGRGKNGGTQDIFYLELSCVVAVAPENGFELVKTGNVDFLAGSELSTSGVRLIATFENGKTEALDNSEVKFDTSKVDMSKDGVYDVTVSYKDYAPITYQVSVYAPVSIELGFDAIEKLANNSAAGNGVYFNHSFKELYRVGDALDTRGLTVIVSAKCGEKVVTFKVKDYEVSGFDSSTWGEKTLTISANGVSAQTVVHVTDSVPTPNEEGVIMTLVDPEYLGPRGGVSGVYYVFSTLQQALDFLEDADATARKEINIAPGYYNEKLEITIPNLTILGVGDTPEDVVIEWDSIYGQLDASGFSHTTDSTATVAIREQAINCVIENVTISNYWNTQERLDAAGLAIERNLALLVQADRFIMKDSRLLAVQDTLELFTGRQYFENVFISGYTDFIFGTNNTTYFKNCTIHVIDTEKDDNGTAGYLTAFKGSNKGAEDAITYGAIFDGCKFTADEGVGGTEEKPAKTAIGRPWGAYAAVAVMNSEIGGHISTAGYSTSKNERYVSMNAKPTDETVQYVEYNNTGAGAISEAVAGMRMLTAEEAARYADFAIIFGTTNGKLNVYLDPWDPNSTEVQVDDRTYYYFNGQTGTSGTYYTYDQNIQGATGTFGNIAIDATKGKVTARAADTQMNAGAKLTFSVKGGTLVTVVSYPGYGKYTLNGVAHNANDMFKQYYAEDTEVVLEATSTAYLYQIIIDPNSEAPETPTLTEIKIDGMKTEYMVGDELSFEGVSVNAYYSDSSIRPITDYSTNASAVNKAEAGEYKVIFTVGGTEIEVTVVYMADMLISETTTIDLSASGANIQGTKANYKQLAVDATNGKFADNGSGWTQVNAGTVITLEVLDGAEVSVVAYSNVGNFDILMGEGVCTITCTANDYLKSITVKYVVVFDETTTIDLSATGANIQGAVGEYEGLTVDATSGKFADNKGGWVQVNTTTVIQLNVVDGAVVTVTAYTSTDNFAISISGGVCTITCIGNDYLKAITVTYN